MITMKIFWHLLCGFINMFSIIRPHQGIDGNAAGVDDIHIYCNRRFLYTENGSVELVTFQPVANEKHVEENLVGNGKFFVIN